MHEVAMHEVGMPDVPAGGAVKRDAVVRHAVVRDAVVHQALVRDAAMLEDDLIHVPMGECQVARRGETLNALLGSCVAIAMLWRAGGRCGVAHCLLPASPGSVLRVGARYVDQAVPSLLKLMGVTEADKGDVEVIVAGGASMLGRASMACAVGKSNVAAAREALAAHGLQLAHLDVGGRNGRQLRVDAAQYSYSVRTIAVLTHDPIAEERDHAVS